MGRVRAACGHLSQPAPWSWLARPSSQGLCRHWHLSSFSTGFACSIGVRRKYKREKNYVPSNQHISPPIKSCYWAWNIISKEKERKKKVKLSIGGKKKSLSMALSFSVCNLCVPWRSAAFCNFTAFYLWHGQRPLFSVSPGYNIKLQLIFPSRIFTSRERGSHSTEPWILRIPKQIWCLD